MDLLKEALIIMSVGMAVTFAFLGIVIAAVNLAARIIHAVEGAPREEGSAASPDAGQEQRRIVAAVAAALHRTAGS